MNSKELVARALQGRDVPRPPVGPLAVHFCAGLAGYTLRQYTTDARALADSVILMGNFFAKERRRLLRWRRDR